jgi:hypothetical protein
VSEELEVLREANKDLSKRLSVIQSECALALANDDVPVTKPRAEDLARVILKMTKGYYPGGSVIYERKPVKEGMGVKKGRRGRRPLHETDPELVERIAWLYWNTDMTASEIAHTRGVSQATVSKYVYKPEYVNKARPDDSEDRPTQTKQHREIYHEE